MRPWETNPRADCFPQFFGTMGLPWIAAMDLQNVVHASVSVGISRGEFQSIPALAFCFVKGCIGPA